MKGNLFWLLFSVGQDGTYLHKNFSIVVTN